MNSVKDIYTLDNGVFADLQKASGEKYTAVFGDVPATVLDFEFYKMAADKPVTFEAEYRDVVAAGIWYRFYSTWVTLTGTDIELANNMDYTVTTEGTNKQVEERQSTQNTDSDSYGFGSDEPANDKDTEQTTNSNGTIDTTNNNVVTYRGRNGGDRIGDYKALYNFQHATINNIMGDVIEYVTVPIYE